MATVQAQVPDDIQAAANDVFRSNGLSMADGVRMFIQRVAEDQALPFDLLQPNAETAAYMKQLAADIQRAIDDPEPGIPHEEVMAMMRADIAAYSRKA
ncbi:MAG: type II toxin-antitoxin system RelB/DinJ family antitoxin [Pseudomonadales bacterium]|jgi:addiction module RelB/DinJ family antitoxin|nr:type II toxin-antitoxin system RelB/DinJ family antitoxin [Pseudomonadales bacterium]